MSVMFFFFQKNLTKEEKSILDIGGTITAWESFLWGDITHMSKHPDRELMTNQNMDIKVHFAEVNFVGVTYKNMGVELIIGAEIRQRQLCHQSPANVGDSS